MGKSSQDSCPRCKGRKFIDGGATAFSEPCPDCNHQVNPYQSPVPEDFKDEVAQQYELALGGFEHMVNMLRERIATLEVENERLKRELASPPKHLMRPPVISFMGFQMESADVDV